MIHSVIPNPEAATETVRTAAPTPAPASPQPLSPSVVVTQSHAALSPPPPAQSETTVESNPQPSSPQPQPPPSVPPSVPEPVPEPVAEQKTGAGPPTSGSRVTSALPLLVNPDWLQLLGRVAILSAVVTAVDHAGIATIETSLGVLTIRIPTVDSAHFAVGTQLQILISQDPDSLQKTIVLALGDSPLPPIDFGLGQNSSDSVKQNWRRATLGEELPLTIAAAPPSEGKIATAAKNGQSQANTAAVIEGLVEVEKTGTPISTAFLASLLGQSGAEAATAIDNRPRATGGQPFTVSPLAISTTTEGFSGPVPILSAVSGEGPGLITSSAKPATQSPVLSEELTLPEALKGVNSGQTYSVKIAGYFDSVGRLITAAGQGPNPPETVAATAATAAKINESIHQDNAQTLFDLGKNYGANSLVIAQSIGQDQQGRAVLAIGAALVTADIAPPKLGSLLLLIWQPPRRLESSLKLQAKSVADAFAILLGATSLGNGGGGGGRGGNAPVAAVVPRLGESLSAQLGFYSKAARDGEISALISPATRNILETIPEAKASLQSLTQAVQKQAMSEGEGWRSMTIPLITDPSVNGLAVQPLHWYFHGGAGEAEAILDEESHKAVKKAGKRFIVDLKLSRLGEIQLDGLQREQNLNLIIRSREPLDLGVRAELNRVFAAAMTKNRLGGTIIFVVADLFVPPISEPVDQTQPGIVV
ncbi:MAG: hypothetical protein QM523_03990 [Candidatus Pacebacteria bacterium]|nr:hypothetical protein [Candidatus Paceibacterota bacterium]